MTKETIKVRLEAIKYSGWDNLEVAINLNRADGKKLYLTYPTCEVILNYRRNSFREKIASKSLKAFLGEGRITGKVSGIIVNKQIAGTPKVNLIDLDDLVAIAVWEATVNQNIEVAKTLAFGFADSLRSIAYEQLGDTLDLEDRQAYLKARLEGKVTRRTLTDAIQSYVERHPDRSPNYRTFVYSNVTDCLNRALFGKISKKLLEERGVKNLRDSFNPQELKNVERREDYAIKLIDQNDVEPLEAMKGAIALWL